MVSKGLYSTPQAQCSDFLLYEVYITVYSRKVDNQLNNKTIFHRIKKAAISILFSKQAMA